MSNVAEQIAELLDQEPERVTVNARGNIVAHYKNYVMEIMPSTTAVTEV